MDKHGQILSGIHADFSVDALRQPHVSAEDEGATNLRPPGDIQAYILLMGAVVLETVHGVSVHDKFHVHVVFSRFIEDDSPSVRRQTHDLVRRGDNLKRHEVRWLVRV